MLPWRLAGWAPYDWAMLAPAESSAAAEPIPKPWVRRLREVHRSAGWPFGDDLELDLLAAGLLQREGADQRAPRVGLTAAGVAACAAAKRRNRSSADPHRELADAVAAHLHAQGRLAWRELPLRAGLAGESTAKTATCGVLTAQEAIIFIADTDDLAPLGSPPAKRWVNVRPDVFSIRPSSRADALEPWVFEVKARRADLLADLARPDKRAAYCALGRTWYVLGSDSRGRPIADADEVPADCGVWQASPSRQLDRPWAFEALRAPAGLAAQTDLTRPSSGLPLGVWMALARSVPWGHVHGTSEAGDPAQLPL